MVFNKLYEARNWFLNYTEFETPVSNFLDLKESWVLGHWKFGDYILFQHIQGDHAIELISRPILGIFISFTVWDQALVSAGQMNFIQKRRAWTYSNEIITNPELNIKMPICTLDDEVENIQFWTDNIYVLEHWKNKPTLGQSVAKWLVIMI